MPDLTITVTTAQANRFRTALGKGTPASLAECQIAIKQWAKDFTVNYEADVAERTTLDSGRGESW